MPASEAPLQAGSVFRCYVCPGDTSLKEVSAAMGCSPAGTYLTTIIETYTEIRIFNQSQLTQPVELL